MYPLKRFLVCLDLSPIDQVLMDYVAALTKSMPDAKVYFIHISKKLEVPEEIRANFPSVTGPADEVIEAGIGDTLSKHFTNKCSTPFEVVVKDGNETEQIIKWSQIKEIDLIVMGLKKSLRGSGTNPAKITSISQCSVLYVPEGFSYKLGRVLIPTDCSKNSAMAVEVGLALKQNKKAELLLQTVYKVPSGYHYTGKSYADFAIIMKHNAENQLKRFYKEHSIDEQQFRVLVTLDDDDKPAEVIFREAKAQSADMIVLGSKGRTMAASFLLGSVAVDLLRLNKEIPYMIVKDKTTTMDFIQAFKNL